LIIELGESKEYPLRQELVLRNSGKRSAIISEIYLTEIKLRAEEFFWNETNTSVGPVLNSLDYPLTPDQTFRFSLDSFNGNLPSLLFSKKFKQGIIALEINYYDTFKWKPFHRTVYFYF